MQSLVYKQVVELIEMLLQWIMEKCYQRNANYGSPFIQMKAPEIAKSS
jgi:hypothetical protein